MRRSWAWLGILIVCCSLGVTLPAQAVSLTFVTIDVPGVAATSASGINAAGQIVGVFWDVSGKTHGYLRIAESTFTTIDPPGSTVTLATGINAAGQIVGSFRDAGGKFHGFLRTSAGTFTTLDVPARWRPSPTGSTTRRRSWARLRTQAFCELLGAPSLRSMFQARPGPMPPGSMTPDRSWASSRTRTTRPMATCE